MTSHFHRPPLKRGKTYGGARRGARLAAAFGVLAALTLSATAQNRMPDRPDNDFMYDFKHDAGSARDMKTPSMWRRPAKSTPEEQMAHARALEEKGALKSARKAFNALVHKWHDSPLATEAQLQVARLHLKANHMLKAFSEYQYALKYCSGSLAQEDILARQFEIANQLRGDLAKSFWTFSRQANADEVVALFRHITRNGPTWERTPECYLLMGLTYEAERRYDEAVLPFENLGIRFPQHELLPTAMLRAAFCRYNLALENPRDERMLRTALSSLAATRRDFPRHQEMDSIVAWMEELRGKLTAMQFENAAFYEKVRRNPNAAIAAYGEFLRIFPNAAEAPLAKERIERLQALNTAQAQQPAAAQTHESTP